MAHQLSDETETAARVQAGHDCMALLHVYGEATAADIVRGRLQAYIAAHAAFSGWSDVQHIVDELYGESHMPPSKPTFTVIDGGRVS